MLSVRSYWLLAALVILAALALLNQWALADYLFWKYVWIDVPLHFLGGIGIGMFVVGFLFTFRPLLFVGLTAVLFIGWEVFEYCMPVVRESNYVFDTSLDLLADTLGALCAYSAARITLWKKIVPASA